MLARPSPIARRAVMAVGGGGPSPTHNCLPALPRPTASLVHHQVGDLQPWMDESFLYNIFVGTNQLVSVKLIRNRATGASEGAAGGAAGAVAGDAHGGSP